jgi:hypothetical protein
MPRGNRGEGEAPHRRPGGLYGQHWLDSKGVGYAISADMSRELAAAIPTLPDAAWQIEREDGDAVRPLGRSGVRAERWGVRQRPTRAATLPGEPR